MPKLSEAVIGLIDIAKITHQNYPDDIIDNDHEFLSKSFRSELALYNQQLSEERELLLLKEVGDIKKFIEKFKTQNAVKIDDIDEANKRLTNLISEIRNQIKSLPKRTSNKFNPIVTSRQKSQDFINVMQFIGVDSVKESPDDFEFARGKTTTKNIVLKKCQDLQKRFEQDVTFIIGVVNCDVKEPFHDRIVSSETLIKSSPQDLEVFDVIHEFERIYGERSFELGMIKMKTREEIDEEKDERRGQKINAVIDDYRLSNIILEKLTKEQTANSVGINIISESSNLVDNSGFLDILNRLPFDKLAQIKIKEINLQFISCNTIKLGSEIVSYLFDIAKKYDFKITTHLYDGYVQNNNSYLYMAQSDYRDLERVLKRRESPASDETGEAYEELEMEEIKNNKTISYREFCKTERKSSPRKSSSSLIERALSDLSQEFDASRSSAPSSPVRIGDKSKFASSSTKTNDSSSSSSSPKNDDLLHNEQNEKKTLRLVQILLPGLSVIDSKDVDDLQKYVQEKSVRDDEGSKKVMKKLLTPNVLIPEGRVFKVEICHRERELGEKVSVSDQSGRLVRSASAEALGSGNEKDERLV